MNRGLPDRLFPRILVLTAVFLIAAVAATRANRFETPAARTSFSAFPMQIGEWRGVILPPFTADVLDVLGLTDYLTRNYVTPDRAAANLYIGYWSSQKQGDTIHSPLNCLPGSGWQPLSQTIVTVPDSRSQSDATIPVNRLVIQQGLDRAIVYYWYQSHGRIIASEYSSRAHLVLDAIRLNRTDGSVVRVVVSIADDSAKAERQADAVGLRFISVLLPQLGTYLPS